MEMKILYGIKKDMACNIRLVALPRQRETDEKSSRRRGGGGGDFIKLLREFREGCVKAERKIRYTDEKWTARKGPDSDEII